MCAMLELTTVHVTAGGTNSGITCAPLCVSSVTTHTVPSTVCVYPQDNGLCGLIAATNIQSISGYSQWSCSTAGYTSSTPCLSPVWPGLSCAGSNVVSMSIGGLGIAGTQFLRLAKCCMVVYCFRVNTIICWQFNISHLSRYVWK